MVHILTIPWYSLNCASQRSYNSLSQSYQGISRSGLFAADATATASCSAMRLCFSRIFMYLREKTRSSSSRRACSATESGSMGLSLRESFLFTSFSYNFSFFNSLLRSAIFRSNQCFLPLSLDYNPFASSSRRSLIFLMSLSKTRITISLFLIASRATFIWSACDSFLTRPTLECFSETISLSSRSYRIFRAANTRRFYSCMSCWDILAQGASRRIQPTCASSSLFSNSLIKIIIQIITTPTGEGYTPTDPTGCQEPLSPLLVLQGGVALFCKLPVQERIIAVEPTKRSKFTTLTPSRTLSKVEVKQSSITLQAFLTLAARQPMLLPLCMRIGLQALASYSKCQQIPSAADNSFLSLLQIAGQFQPDYSCPCLEEALIEKSKDQRLQQIAVKQAMLEGQTHSPAAPAKQPVENEVGLEELLPKSRGFAEAQPVSQVVHSAKDRLEDQRGGEYEQELAEAEGNEAFPASSERGVFSHAI